MSASLIDGRLSFLEIHNMRLQVIAILFPILLGCALPSLGAQTSSCLTDAAGAAREVGFAKDLLQNSDSAALAARGFPFATATQITLVTDDSICAQALDAYNAHLPPGSDDRAGQAYLVRLSGNGYVVVVPSDTTGEFLMRHVYDAAWILKASIAG